MRNRMYGGVRGRKTKVGEKLLRFPPTRFFFFSKVKKTAFGLLQYYLKLLLSSLTNLLSVCFLLSSFDTSHGLAL